MNFESMIMSLLCLNFDLTIYCGELIPCLEWTYYFNS